MNPNSAHQQWSEWVFTVETVTSAAVTLADVTVPLGRFFTALFGSAGRMKIDEAVNAARRRTLWTVTAQVEGESVFAPGWRAHVLQAFTLAAQRRFGDAVRVTMDVRLLAGQTADARPDTQWLILPTIEDTSVASWRGPVPTQALGLPTVPAATRMW
jgi:hypothetical protein